MLIRVLGARGEVKPSLSCCSRHFGVVVDGTSLLDLGEREFLEWEPRSVFITHLHPDHACFLRYGSRVRILVPVYAPSNDGWQLRHRREGMVRRDKETGEVYGHNSIPNLIRNFGGLVLLSGPISPGRRKKQTHSTEHGA